MSGDRARRIESADAPRSGHTVHPVRPRSRACPTPTRQEAAITADAPPHAAAAARRPRFATPAPLVAWLIAALLLWLLVGPRLDLTGPLRVEDLVLGLLGVLCLAHLRVLGRPRGITIAMGGVIAAGLVAAAVGSARGMVSPVEAALFAVRPLEYWVAFPAVLLLLSAARGAWFRRIDVLLAVVTVLQFAFAVAQYYLLIPVGFSHAAYTRAAGLTVGPYELGAISAALVVYWAAKGRWVLASAAVVALAASISRISMLGAVAGFAVLAVAWAVRTARVARRTGWRSAVRPRGSRLHTGVQVLSVAAAGLVLAFTVGVIKLPEAAQPAQPPVAEQPAQPSGEPSDEVTPTPSASASEDAQAPDAPVIAVPDDSLATRLASTSVIGSWIAAGQVAATVPHVHDSVQYADIAYSHINDYLNQATANGSTGEPSNIVRFFRWHLLLNTFDEPADYVFGLGPSFVGPSVDGSYLRMFADGGLLGLTAWIALIVMWFRRTPLWMRCVTVTLLVGAVFIDIVYAERPMVLYWALLAIAVAPRPSWIRLAPAEPAAEDAPSERDLVRA